MILGRFVSVFAVRTLFHAHFRHFYSIRGQMCFLLEYFFRYFCRHILLPFVVIIISFFCCYNIVNTLKAHKQWIVFDFLSILFQYNKYFYFYLYVYKKNQYAKTCVSVWVREWFSIRIFSLLIHRRILVIALYTYRDDSGKRFYELCVYVCVSACAIWESNFRILVPHSFSDQ